MLGNGCGRGNEGKEQPLDAVGSERFRQLLVGLVAEVDTRRIAEGEVGRLEIGRELAAVQLVAVSDVQEGGNQIEAGHNTVAVYVGDGGGQPGVGAVEAAAEDVAARAVDKRLVDAGVYPGAQLLHQLDDDQRRGEEEEGDEAVGEEPAGVHPAAGGDDGVEDVPEAEGGQREDEQAAERRGEGVDEELHEVTDVLAQPAVDALGNNSDGQGGAVDGPQDLRQGVLQEVDRFGEIASRVKHLFLPCRPPVAVAAARPGAARRRPSARGRDRG